MLSTNEKDKSSSERKQKIINISSSSEIYKNSKTISENVEKISTFDNIDIYKASNSLGLTNTLVKGKGIPLRRHTFQTFPTEFEGEKKLINILKKKNTNVSNETTSITILPQLSNNCTSKTVSSPVSHNLPRNLKKHIHYSETLSLSTMLSGTFASVTSVGKSVGLKKLNSNKPIHILPSSTIPTSIESLSGNPKLKKTLPNIATSCAIQPVTLKVAKEYIKKHLFASLYSSLNENTKHLSQEQLMFSSKTNPTQCVTTTSMLSTHVGLKSSSHLPIRSSSSFSTSVTSTITSVKSAETTLLPLTEEKLLTSEKKQSTKSKRKRKPPGILKKSVKMSLSSSAQIISTSSVSIISNITSSSSLDPKNYQNSLSLTNNNTVSKSTNKIASMFSSSPDVLTQSRQPLATSSLNTTISSNIPSAMIKPLFPTSNCSVALPKIIGIFPQFTSNSINQYNSLNTKPKIRSIHKVLIPNLNIQRRCNIRNENLEEKRPLLNSKTLKSVSIQCNIEDMEDNYEFLVNFKNIDPSCLHNRTEEDELAEFIETTTLHYENGFIECLKCGEILKNKPQMQDHMTSHFRSNVLCTSCGNFLNILAKPNEHQCIIENIPSNRENVIKKKSNKKNIYKKILQNNLKFHCPYYCCNIVAKCSKSLYKHINEQHVYPRKYSCKVCGRNDFTNLKQHLEHTLKHKYSMMNTLYEENLSNIEEKKSLQSLAKIQQTTGDSDTNNKRRKFRIQIETLNGKYINYKGYKAVNCLLPKFSKLREKQICQICLKIFNNGYQFKRHQLFCVSWHKQRCLTRQSNNQM